jgi:hypothetical protein
MGEGTGGAEVGLLVVVVWRVVAIVAIVAVTG